MLVFYRHKVILFIDFILIELEKIDLWYNIGIVVVIELKFFREKYSLVIIHSHGDKMPDFDKQRLKYIQDIQNNKAIIDNKVFKVLFIITPKSVGLKKYFIKLNEV